MTNLEQTHTSLWLSKLFHQNGCELESDIYMYQSDCLGVVYEIDYHTVDYLGPNRYKSYDILNDICVRYAKEFFNWNDIYHPASGGSANCDAVIQYKLYRPERILRFLVDRHKDQAEKYIWRNCLFNPENKK